MRITLIVAMIAVASPAAAQFQPADIPPAANYQSLCFIGNKEVTIWSRSFGVDGVKTVVVDAEGREITFTGNYSCRHMQLRPIRR